MRIRSTVRALAMVTAAAAVTGLAVAATAPGASAASTRPTLTFVPGLNRTVVSTHRVHPGVIHVRNVGHRTGLLLIPRHGETRTIVVRDYNGGSGAALRRDFVSVASLRAGTNAYFKVLRGPIFVLFQSDRPIHRANVTAVRLSGAARNDRPPRSFHFTITAAHEALTPLERTVPAASYLRLSDHTGRQRSYVLVPVRRGVSTAAVRHFVHHPVGGGLSKVANRSRLQLLTIMSNYRALVLQYHLRPGRYVLWDFNPLGPSPFRGPHFALVIAK